MSGRRNRIGRHLPTSGGLRKTLEIARDLGCETAQIFVSNPQGWADAVPRPDAEAFAEGSREVGLLPVVAHAKYLINLATANDELRRRSVRALAQELMVAGALGVDLVVVHAGSHGGDGEEKGMERLAGSLDEARDLASGIAGGSGPVVEPVVALLHLNDAKNELGSHRDGHRKIGEGRIHEESWPDLFAALPRVPLIMETPYDRCETDAEEVRRVKDLAGGLLVSPDGV